MEFLQLKYFRSAAETENFSHTAKKYMVPQSTISSAIKKLETELGFKLFDRVGNKVILNEKGKTFKSAVDSGLNSINTAATYLKGQVAYGFATVSLIINTNRSFVFKCITGFKEKYPNTSFVIKHISEKSSEDIDIIIDDANIKHSNMLAETLIEENFVLGVNKSHPLAKKKNIVFSNIEEESFISMPTGNSLHRILTNYFYINSREPKIDIFCDDPYYIRKYIEINLGVAIWPQFSWHNMDNENVCLIPISDMPFSRITLLYTSPNISLKPVSQKFAEYLKEMAIKEKDKRK